MLVRRDTFESYVPAQGSSAAAELTRTDAIGCFMAELAADDILVSTTGMASREVWAYRELHGQPHDRDFLTVGSMGHSSQIALGIAQRSPANTVFCLDGDGAVLMHLGSLAIIGSQAPPNLRHVVINNGAHDSVGGQPTAMREVDLLAVSRACGYRIAEAAATEQEIASAMTRVRTEPGPSLLEIRVASRASTDAGRPTTSPVQNKAAFMRAIGNAGS